MRALAALRRRYGAPPAHLLGHVAALAVIGWALWALLPGGGWSRALTLLLWLVAGAVLHDLVVLPLYSLADRGAQRATRRRPRLLNHVRVPAAISGVLLLVYFPLILGRPERSYERATGHAPAGYLRDWLLITAGAFAVSAAGYGLRSWRDHLRRPARGGDDHAAGARIDGDGPRPAQGRQAP